MRPPHILCAVFYGTSRLHGVILQMKTYLSLAVSAAALSFAASAQAQSTSDVSQTGNQNVVEVDQTNSNNLIVEQIGDQNFVDADQTGNGNDGFINQLNGNLNRAFNRQFGLNSSSEIRQIDGADNNNAVVTQGARTDGSLAIITQSGFSGAGDNNRAVAAQEKMVLTTIFQDGNNNQADSRSEGVGTISDIVQAGVNNRATIRQFADADGSSSMVFQGGTGGTGHVAEVNQNGSVGSFSSIGQSGGTNNLATLFQIGDGGTSFILQDGDDNVTDVLQEGNNNTSTVNQNLLSPGGTNTATVDQFSDGNNSTVNQNGIGNTATVTQGSSPI